MLGYWNDVRRIRYFTRYFKYKMENFEFYRLLLIRSKMINHKFVNKEEIIKNSE